VRRWQSEGTRGGAGSQPAPLAFLRSPLPSLGLALATAMCLLAAGCSSPVADPSSIFPAVQDKPPQRLDTPMTQVEVQKATEDLISERDRLNAQAPQNAPQNPPTNSAAATTDKAQNAAIAGKKAVRKHAPQQAAATAPATTASAQGAGEQAAGVQAAGTDLKP
jgi:hypothetical protein